MVSFGLQAAAQPLASTPLKMVAAELCLTARKSSYPSDIWGLRAKKPCYRRGVLVTFLNG